jgi:hypothetical protein
MTAAASAQVSKFCFHRAILGIKLQNYIMGRKEKTQLAETRGVGLKECNDADRASQRFGKFLTYYFKL